MTVQLHVRLASTRAGGIPHGASVAAVGFRSRSVVAAGAFLLLAVTGCAAAVGTRAESVPCVPPGMPPVATWVVRDARVVAMRSPDRQTLYAALLDYQVGTTHVRAVWIGQDLILVDPDADDPGRLFWRNRGALDASWALIGVPTCDWVEESGQRT